MGAMSVWHWLVLFVVVPLQFAVAIWIIGLFAFKDREPDERAFKLVAAAWAAWSILFALRASSAAELIMLPVFYAVLAIPIWLLVRSRMRKKWAAQIAEQRTFE